MMIQDDKQEDFFASESEPTGPEGPSAVNLASDDEDDEDDEDFNWKKAQERGLIAVHHQREIAVYQNPFGGIVLRAEAGEYEDGDSVIVLASLGAAYRLIEAIQQQADLLKHERASAKK